MDLLRIGIVGAQFAAHLHLQNYKPLRGSKVEIAGIASRTKARAEELARKFSIPHVADDYRRLLERKDIDAVDLCVPTDLHHEFIIQAAQAGKHVICEKPLTGYFGKDRPEDLVGFAVDRGTMLQEALANCQAVGRGHRRKQNQILLCRKLGLCAAGGQAKKSDPGEPGNHPGHPRRGKPFGFSCRLFPALEDRGRRRPVATGSPPGLGRSAPQAL